MRNLIGAALLAACFSNAAQADTGCLNKILASIRVAQASIGLGTDNQVAMGEPGAQLKKSIRIEDIKHNTDQMFDVVGFIIGNANTAVLSNAAMVQEVPGAYAIGTITVVKDAKTFGELFCEVTKVEITKLQN